MLIKISLLFIEVLFIPFALWRFPKNKKWLGTYWLLLPYLTAATLWSVSFHLDTKETLNLIVPLLWGVFVAVGGSVIYLNKLSIHDKGEATNSTDKKILKASKFFVNLGAINLFQALTFLLSVVIYPVRSFFIRFFEERFEIEIVTNLRSLYDISLYTHIFIIGFGALVLGMWSLYTSYHFSKDKE